VGISSLSWWKTADINDIFGVFDEAFVVGAEERGAGEGNKSGSSGFEDSEGGDKFHEGVDSDWFCGALWMSIFIVRDWGMLDLHFYDTAISADVQYFPTKLMCKIGNRLQMLMLMSQRLTECQFAWVEIIP
jgi:hypothetical protein